MDKIIVVDDEARQCRGVKNILLRRYENLEVEVFTSAEDALEYIGREHIKIVITDICMPDMDGLALTQRIRLQDSSVKVILLTGYAEFEYARQAISLGAFEYLLKPLNPEKLCAVIDRAREELREEEILHRQQEKLKEKLDMTLPVYTERLFNQWVYGRLSPQELAEVGEIIPEGENGFVLAVRFPGLWRCRAFQDKDEAVRLRSSLIWGLREQIGRPWHSLSFFSTVLADLMISVVTDTDTGRVTMETERAGMNRSLAALEKWIGRHSDFQELTDSVLTGKIRIGVSTLRPSLTRHIESCYREAVETLEYGFYFPDTHILRAEYILNHRADNISISPVQEEAVRTAVRRGDGERAVRELTEIWDFFTGGYFAPAELKREFETMIDRIAAAVKSGRRLAENEDEDCELFLERIGRELELLAKEVSAGRDGRDTEFVRELRAFLESHYGQEISLDDIAMRFSLTPAYCSALIKETSGSNFSTMLLEIRMEKARELLRETNLKIYEIAIQTGYGDVKYFNRVFKRENGVTPVEYREDARKLERRERL